MKARLAIAAAVIGAGASASEPEILATLDRDEVSMGSTVTMTVTVSVDKEASELRMPESPDFDVVSRSQSSQMSFSFGGGGGARMKNVKVYTIVLAPKRSGTFTFRAGKLVVDGKTYETGAMRIRVVQQGQATPRPRRQQQPQLPQQSPFQQQPLGQNPFAPFGQNPFSGFPGMGDEPDMDPFQQLFGGGVQVQGEKDLFIRSAVDRPKVFLGEQTTLSIYLFSRVPVSQVAFPPPVQRPVRRFPRVLRRIANWYPASPPSMPIPFTPPLPPASRPARRQIAFRGRSSAPPTAQPTVLRPLLLAVSGRQ